MRLIASRAISLPLAGLAVGLLLHGLADRALVLAAVWTFLLVLFSALAVAPLGGTRRELTRAALIIVASAFVTSVAVGLVTTVSGVGGEPATLMALIAVAPVGPAVAAYCVALAPAATGTLLGWLALHRLGRDAALAGGLAAGSRSVPVVWAAAGDALSPLGHLAMALTIIPLNLHPMLSARLRGARRRAEPLRLAPTLAQSATLECRSLIHQGYYQGASADENPVRTSGSGISRLLALRDVQAVPWTMAL